MSTETTDKLLEARYAISEARAIAWLLLPQDIIIEELNQAWLHVKKAMELLGDDR